MTTTIYFSEMETPLGRVMLAATEAGLCGVYFHDQRYLPETRGTWQRDDARFGDIRAQLGAYFGGESAVLDVALDPVSGTAFQREVWKALREIRPGQTWTYAQVAAHVGRPQAVRAVGAAVGRNPLSVIVPCHRVIGRGGALTGYAGGQERNRWLLAHEAGMNAEQ